MQTGSMEDFQTITDAVAAGSELVTFVAYKAKRPEIWLFYFTDGQLTQFRIGSEHHYSITNCDQAVLYNPQTQKFDLIKNRHDANVSRSMVLVWICKRYLQCDIDMNGKWLNPADATFFHLKWAGQPNQSY